MLKMLCVFRKLDATCRNRVAKNRDSLAAFSVARQVPTERSSGKAGWNNCGSNPRGRQVLVFLRLSSLSEALKGTDPSGRPLRGECRHCRIPLNQRKPAE